MSLCPGYKHVQTFGPDDDYQDEEVAYLTLDLGSIEPTLVPSSSTYRLIADSVVMKGLDTPTPFLQLSGTILKGRHESLLGTELIFTDGKDPHDPSKKSITHTANTSQRICFREVRLHPKGTLPKGKTAAKDSPALEGWVVEAEAASHMVDRVTGKSAPKARAPRRSAPRARADEEVPGEPSMKRTTRARKAKGKGKAKANVDEEEGEAEMQVDVDEDDSMDVYEP
ncbi:hypothetical protein C0989_000912 [Termitomyces sp. Mn162]|nr:hypothetical protein C0989_000912 [Termitomyces sp. Mn162]